jgi:hypothetical protein
MLLDGLIKKHNVDSHVCVDGHVCVSIYIHIYRVASREALHLKS